MPASEDVLALVHRASSHGALGDVEEAGAWFRRALALDPDNPVTWLAIISSDQHDVEEPDLARIASIPRRRTLTDEQRAMWHFALAKLQDRRGLHQDAWTNFEAGNAQLRRFRPYDDTVDARHARAVLGTVDAAWFSALADVVRDVAAPPIFVLGFPGSGTTLVEQILATHQLVRGGGEQLVVMRAAAALTRQVPPDTSYVEALTTLAPDATRAQAATALASYREAAGSLPRVTDKLPANYHHVGLIRVLFPTAPIVHVRRDPVDTCVSNYLRLYTKGHDYTNDVESLALAWARYARVTAHWQATMPAPMLEIDYADLVYDQEPVTRRLLAHCDLDWDPDCLAFHETRRLVNTASRDQVRRPIYQTSVGRSGRFGARLDPLRRALAAHDAI